MLSPDHRRELSAISALLLGLFVGLALLPVDWTGPLGRGVGRLLWTYLGSGAALLPLLGLAAALAGFGRWSVASLGRVAGLFAGLTVLVPFAIAVVAGVRSPEAFPPTYAEWSVVQKLVGILPALLAVGATSVIGTAGAVILFLLSLSLLTVVTVGWHPFNKLIAGREELDGKNRTEQTGREEQGGKNRTEQTGRNEQDGTDRTEPTGREELDGREWAGGEDEEYVLPLRRRAPRKGRQVGGRAAEQGEDEGDPLPPIDLLAHAPRDAGDAGEAELEKLGEVLIQTLGTFRVEGQIVGRTTGPVVTQFEVAPAPGVKVGRIAALADDLALAMRAQSIRIVAPIPGKAAVGVEVPNPHARIVTLRELLEAPEWDRSRGALPIALGRNLEGRPVVADLSKMPHLLIAGATGSGKSVCINTIITSLIYRYTPQELRMIMIDPKMVELSMYNTLPHLRHPVVTNNKHAAQALKWVMFEMERRYELFHANNVRNMGDFNRKLGEGKEMLDVGEGGGRRAEGRGLRADGRGLRADGRGLRAEGRGVSEDQLSALDGIPYASGPLPFIVVIVDELADLMMTVQGEVEKPLAILAQKARATGIHLLLATQRPSVNVITGLIKANFPSRIAFRVASKVDSRTILDQNGAETLLGNGDMLFLPPGKSEPVRVQGAYIGTEETEAVMAWYRELGLRAAARDEEDIIAVVETIEAAEAAEAAGGAPGAASGERDPLFREAAEVCIANQLGSTSLLQRKLRIGYGRAARIIDQLHDAGILGPPDGSKPREVMIGMGQLDEYCE
jgi:S-DNA-T family DNA segregation ATPase FtsK/SpoIIIE